MVEILKMFDLTPHDATMIVAWAVFFTLLWQVLAKICWQPMLLLIEAREAATVGASTRVKHLAKQAEDLARSFENEMLKARMEAVKAKSAVVQEAKTAAQTDVATAERAAMIANKQAAQKLAAQAVSVERELESQISTLSDQAVAKMGIR